MSNQWAKIKASGSFRRQVKRKRDMLKNEMLINENSDAKIVCQEMISNTSFEPNSSSAELNPSAGSSSMLSQNHPDSDEEEDSVYPGDDAYFSPSEGEEDLPDMTQAIQTKCSDDFDEGKTTEFATFLQHWASDFNISQAALKPLMSRLNSEFRAGLYVSYKQEIYKASCIDLAYTNSITNAIYTAFK